MLFQNHLFLYRKLKIKFCCQCCDVIFPPKTFKIDKLKAHDFLKCKVLLPAKLEPNRFKKTHKSYTQRPGVLEFFETGGQKVLPPPPLLTPEVLKL